MPPGVPSTFWCRGIVDGSVHVHDLERPAERCDASALGRGGQLLGKEVQRMPVVDNLERAIGAGNRSDPETSLVRSETTVKGTTFIETAEWTNRLPGIVPLGSRYAGSGRH
jgi:hypothetical protein